MVDVCFEVFVADVCFEFFAVAFGFELSPGSFAHVLALVKSVRCSVDSELAFIQIHNR